MSSSHLNEIFSFNFFRLERQQRDTEYINLHTRHSLFRFLLTVDLKTYSSEQAALVISYSLYLWRNVRSEKNDCFLQERNLWLPSSAQTELRVFAQPAVSNIYSWFNLFSFFSCYFPRAWSLFALRWNKRAGLFFAKARACFSIGFNIGFPVKIHKYWYSSWNKLDLDSNCLRGRWDALTTPKFDTNLLTNPNFIRLVQK